MIDYKGNLMKLNYVEKLLMNNPVRAFVQSRYEVPLLIKLGGTVSGKDVLEVGCGRGIGTELIFERFGAKTVRSIDLDPSMVRLAKQRLSRFSNSVLKVSVGDVSQIDAQDGSFDAVFDFGIIHHVPDWQKAITEIFRVLKPGGQFYFEEVTSHALERWFYRKFLEHPIDNRFSGSQFVEELERQGLAVGNRYVEKFFGDFVIGVAKKL